jgi:hypothetical protein
MEAKREVEEQCRQAEREAEQEAVRRREAVWAAEYEGFHALKQFLIEQGYTAQEAYELASAEWGALP